MNNIFNLKTNITDKIDNYSDIIKFVEKTSLNNDQQNITAINVGDIIRIEYNISLEKDKIRLETYEGLVISKKNKNNNKAIVLRRNVRGIIIEQTIPLYSPKIKSIITKKKSKTRRSKLYFIKKLSEKKIKNKLKFY
jgi:large subunit ribosomal protein L19